MFSENPESLQAEVERLREYSQALENELAKSRSVERRGRFERIVNEMPVMLIAFNARRNITFWNLECERVTGFPRHEIVGRGVALRKLIPSTDLRREIRNRMLDPKLEQRRWEFYVQHRASGRRHIAWHSLTGRIAVPGWIGWGIGFDITRHSEARFDAEFERNALTTILESSPDAISMLDLERYFVRLNDAALRVLGAPNKEAVLEKRIEEMLPADLAAPNVNAELRALQSADDKVEFEETVLVDGEQRILSTIVAVCRSEKGRPQGLVRLSRDITTRVQAERELRQLRDGEFLTVAETVRVPLAIAACETGTVLHANESLADLLSHSREALEGRPLHTFVLGKARERLAKATRRGRHVRSKHVRTRIGGESLHLSLTLVPLIFRDQRCVLATFVDVTDQVEEASRLRNERQLLKRLVKVNELTLELIASEIHDGIAQQFFAGQAYLEACLGNHPFLGDDPLSDFMQALDAVKGGLSDVRQVINGLRPPLLEKHGLNPALTHLIEDFRNKRQMQIELALNRSGRLAPVVEIVVFRIVQEALTNVWKHAGPCIAQVSVSESEDRIHLTVRDNGRGFEPQEVDPSRYGLTGIRERVRLLNGASEIVSALGAGTRITVVIPLNDLAFLVP